MRVRVAVSVSVVQLEAVVRHVHVVAVVWLVGRRLVVGLHLVLRGRRHRLHGHQRRAGAAEDRRVVDAGQDVGHGVRGGPAVGARHGRRLRW